MDSFVLRNKGFPLRAPAITFTNKQIASVGKCKIESPFLTGGVILNCKNGGGGLCFRKNADHAFNHAHFAYMTILYFFTPIYVKLL